MPTLFAAAPPPLAPPAFPAHDDAVRRWGTLTPEHPALVEHGAEGGAWTYAALDRRADAWVRVLLGSGVGPGDRVAMLAGTRAECVALFYGCLRLGAALVPLNWRLAAPELARVIADARPAVLVAEPRWADLAARAGGAVRTLSLDSAALEDGARAASVKPHAVRPHAVRPDAVRPIVDRAPDGPEDATMLLYTSGSTGAPKGVVLPRRQLLFNAVATVTGWQLTAGEVVPVSTPLFHTGGWHVLLTPALHAGITTVLFDGFEPDAFLDGLAAHGCTRAFAVPTQFATLVESPRWGTRLPALRRFVSGGAPCPSSVRAAVRAAGYRFREGYGLTECGPNCFMATDAMADAHPGAVGLPVPFLDVRLVADDGQALGGLLGTGDVDVPGELQLRGPQLFAGYFGAPERTVEAMTADGWLRTGDLARRDAHGLFRICGRRKEMYISGGENVFPGEVETALGDCAGVREVAVVGVPDARWGEVGCAFVVADGDAAAVRARVVAHARATLAGYKVPKRVVVHAAPLPRLGSGKIDRRALVATALTGEGLTEAER